MTLNTHIFLEEIKKKHEETLTTSLFEHYYAHFGEFDQDTVTDISVEMEEKLKASGVSKKIVKRIFSVIVEGLQNIKLHGLRDESGLQPCYLLITRKNDAFEVYFCNIVDNESVSMLTKKMEYINSITAEELKELYLSVLSNGLISSKGGAGLGFITMGLKSDERIQYSFSALNNFASIFQIRLLFLPQEL